MECKCFAFTLLHFWNYLLLTNSGKYFSTIEPCEIYISKMNISENMSYCFYCIRLTLGKMIPDKLSPVIYIRCNFCKMQETWYLRCFDLDENTWCWLNKSMQLMKVLHYTTDLANLAVLFVSWVIDWKTIAFIYSSIDGYRILDNKITINQNWLVIQLFITFCNPPLQYSIIPLAIVYSFE